MMSGEKTAPVDARDTIAAPATPPGLGGIGIVRVSGPRAAHIGAVLTGSQLVERRAVACRFLDEHRQPIDAGLAIAFTAPRSYTGEDVLELHGHGGPVVQDMLLRRVLALGARLARPGEFTERAFLNDKLDLAEAEAVADLIESSSEQAARAALGSLRGEFSRFVNALVEQLVALRVHIEAALDFPDEEIDFLADRELHRRIAALAADLAHCIAGARQGVLLREGLRVVIAGRPNVGKSSLINRLAGADTAIVTATPGTTRDVLRERLNIDGLPLHVADTAGMHESGDEIEREGIRRAWREVEHADLVLLVVDAREGVGEQDSRIIACLHEAGARFLVLHNKADLLDRPAHHDDGELVVSAVTGEGVDTLTARLKQEAGYRDADAGAFIARRRHLNALQEARVRIEAAAAILDQRNAGELAAEELAIAQRELGVITGTVTTEELLGRIFSSFCIGK